MDETEVAQTVTKTKNWWNRNKFRLLGTVTVVTTTYAVLLRRNQRHFNEFLAEEGLLAKYYTPEYYEELQNKE